MWVVSAQYQWTYPQASKVNYIILLSEVDLNNTFYGIDIGKKQVGVSKHGELEAAAAGL